MNYFITNAQLTFMETSGQIDWVGWGFDIPQIQAAARKGFQQVTDDGFVSIFPIAHEDVLTTRLQELGADFPGFFSIVSEAEAVAERDRLKAINDEAEELRKNTPTDDDIFKAQQLLLLTEISLKLGGTSNV